MKSDTKPKRAATQSGRGKYSSADRHVAIVETLCAHPAGLTVKEVHAALKDKEVGSCCERTVQSDLRHLAERPHRIEVERVGKADRYRWIAGRPAWAIEIDDRERVLLMLAQEHLEHLLPKEVRDLIGNKLNAPSSRPQNGGAIKPLLDWPNRVHDVPLLPRLRAPTVSPEVLSSVSTALLRNFVLNITYRNLQGRKIADKPVLPLALVRQAERLYLVCRFKGHEDTRHLALHRIEEAVLTTHPFMRPEFSLDKYVKQGSFGFGNGEQITLKIAVQPHLATLLEESPLADQQTIKPLPGGRFEVTATVIRGEQIRWWIRMHGAAIQLLEPKGLLDEVDSSQPAKTPS